MALPTFGFKSYLQTLYHYNKPQLPRALILVFFAGLTEGIGLMLLLPLLASLGIGQAGGNPVAVAIQELFARLGIPFELPTILGLFILMVTLRSGIVFWRDIYLMNMQLEFVDSFRSRLHRAIGQANWLFLSKQRTSDLSHVLTSDIARIGFGTQLLLQTLVSVTLGLAYLTTSLYLALELTLLVVAVGIALLWLLRRYGRNALLLGQEQTKTGKAVFASVSEFLSGIKLVKSYSMEHFYHQYFEDTITQQRQKQLAFKHSNSLAQQLFQISAAILLSILLYAAITVFAISSAELLILAVIFVRLMPLLSSLQRNHEQILHMLPAYASAMHLQEECVAAAEDRSASGNRLKLEHGIHLQDVAFAYKVDSPTLKQVNVSIPVSQTTAIIGASGAGKSTLADMLAGLMLPDTGVICIDDVALNANNLIAWRSEVAYVPQEVFLFHDTLRANMRWVAPTCSDNDIWQALELAAAQHFVEQLPQGLDTVIGERGIRLSGGERQRIALARALLRKPALLILDEATSALDHQNEQTIKDSLKRLHGKMTIILIAHRLTTVESADQILMVQDRQVVRMSPDSITSSAS